MTITNQTNQANELQNMGMNVSCRINLLIFTNSMHFKVEDQPQIYIRQERTRIELVRIEGKSNQEVVNPII